MAFFMPRLSYTWTLTGVMDQEPHVMYKIKHHLSLVSEVRRHMRTSMVTF
jgi:hypothetical protein